MSYDPDKHHRRSIRLRGYDYASAGVYFITICVQHRLRLFGEVSGGVMRLNEAGRMVGAAWQALPERFENLTLDVYQVMPNHMHGLLVLHDAVDHVGGEQGNGYGGEPCVRPNPCVHPHGTVPGSVGRVVQAFKSITTHRYIDGVHGYGWPPYDRRLWQRDYWERVVRTREEGERIRRYIAENPLRWRGDLCFVDQ